MFNRNDDFLGPFFGKPAGGSRVVTVAKKLNVSTVVYCERVATPAGQIPEIIHSCRSLLGSPTISNTSGKILFSKTLRFRLGVIFGVNNRPFSGRSGPRDRAVAET
jgi:hypothetical protein